MYALEAAQNQKLKTFCVCFCFYQNLARNPSQLTRPVVISGDVDRIGGKETKGGLDWVRKQLPSEQTHRQCAGVPSCGNWGRQTRSRHVFKTGSSSTPSLHWKGMLQKISLTIEKSWKEVKAHHNIVFLIQQLRAANKIQNCCYFCQHRYCTRME